MSTQVRTFWPVLWCLGTLAGAEEAGCEGFEPGETSASCTGAISELAIPFVAALQDPDFERREAATAELRRMGSSILPRLKALRARTEDPELQTRLDQILSGPQVRERSAAEWMVRLGEGDYRDRVEALGALEEAGAAALPQVQALLEDADPLPHYAGLWLTTQLGTRAAAARGTLKALLERELLRAGQEQDAEDGAAGRRNGHGGAVGAGAPFHAWLAPRDPELGDPPVVDVFLEEREGEGYSDPNEIQERLQREVYGAERECVLAPRRAEAPAGETKALLYGVVRVLQHGKAERERRFRVEAGLRLRLLCYGLERVGLDEEAEAGVLRARLCLAGTRTTGAARQTTAPRRDGRRRAEAAPWRAAEAEGTEFSRTNE